MKTCKQIRKDAWALLQGKWFGRIAVVVIALYAISMFVNYAIGVTFTALSIDSLGDFLQHKAQASKAGLVYALPSTRAYVWMTVGWFFQSFIAYIFTSISLFGTACVLLKAEANDDCRWFADSFDGFSRPFESMGLLLLVNTKVLLWSLLFVLPGIVAIYRYRQAWFVKIEHPDWTASACLAESGHLMRGVKWKAFRLDLTYLFACGGSLIVVNMLMALSFVALSTKGVVGLIAGTVGLLCAFFGFYLFVKLFAAMAVARVIFYRAILTK